MSVEWLSDFIAAIAKATGGEYFVVKAVLALLLVCLLCGMVGSLVVGNRMAFFSDAMAHCAFAGIALGYLSLFFAGKAKDASVTAWLVPLVMVLFGAAVGAAIVYVRENTTLANDTVIGVFFALAIGFGAMLFKVLQELTSFNPESFLFGTPLFVPEIDLLFLLALLAFVVGLFAWRYNQIVFASFNPSLARTRRVSLRVNNYLFIVLLALVVNLSIQAVGALLINALLVVPAATAANVSRNLRQMFWLTILFCVGAGLIGFWLSIAVAIPVQGHKIKFGPSGTVVVVSVALFFLSIMWAGLRGRSASPSLPR
jgi:zinc transport system permease protein